MVVVFVVALPVREDDRGGPKTNSSGMFSPKVRANFAIFRRRSLSVRSFRLVLRLTVDFVGLSVISNVGERGEKDEIFSMTGGGDIGAGGAGTARRRYRRGWES